MENNLDSNRATPPNLFLPEISIIIPAKEEPYLPILIKKIKKVLKNKKYEILIEKEEGFGNAIRCGFKKARGKKIIVMDADGQHNPVYLPKIINDLKNYDLVVCSRIKDKRSILRRILSRMINWYIRKKFKLKVSDPLSGFFGVRKKIIKNLDLKTNGFKVCLEIMLKRKASIKEVPIVLEKRKMGKSKASIKELIELWKINF